MTKRILNSLTIGKIAAVECDPNRLPPAFNIGMQDNYFPVAPEGNELTPPAVPDGTL